MIESGGRVDATEGQWSVSAPRYLRWYTRGTCSASMLPVSSGALGETASFLNEACNAPARSFMNRLRFSVSVHV